MFNKPGDTHAFGQEVNLVPGSSVPDRDHRRATSVCPLPRLTCAPCARRVSPQDVPLGRGGSSGWSLKSNTRPGEGWNGFATPNAKWLLSTT